jgi:hypothetical protein
VSKKVLASRDPCRFQTVVMCSDSFADELAAAPQSSILSM